MMPCCEKTETWLAAPTEPGWWWLKLECRRLQSVWVHQHNSGGKPELWVSFVANAAAYRCADLNGKWQRVPNPIVEGA